MYKSPKVVFAKMAKSCEAMIDLTGEYASLNTNCFHNPQGSVSLKFIGGVCNSRMFMFLYDLLFGALRMSGGYYQFQAPQLRVIPIAEADARQQGEVERLVDRILNAKRGNPLANTCALEHEIDDIVYRLYDLADTEIAVVEGRHPDKRPPTDTVAKPTKPPATRQPRKTVLTDDPDLA
jgi:hypothetical protein